MPRPLAAVSLALLLAGCDRDVYTVEMCASPEGFQRSLEVVREEANGQRKAPPDEVLRPIASAFGARAGAGGRFSGEFDRSTPSDIGGAGRLERAETSLGTTFVYIERFRGDDDLSARVERVQTAAEVLAHTIVDWLAFELADQPSFAAATVRERLVADARNLALITWQAKNAARRHGDEAESELTPAIVMYLFEHGYITGPQLAWAGAAPDGDVMSELLVSWLARETGLSPGAAPLSHLASDEGLGASWATYTAQPRSRDRALRWAMHEGVPLADLELGDLLSMALTVATGGEHGTEGADDRVELTLACPVEPVETNGDWSETARQIRWRLTIEPTERDAYRAPAIAFAAWSVPNDPAQTQRLGSVALSGETLARYTAWHARLPTGAAHEWEQLVAGWSGRRSALDSLARYSPTDPDRMQPGIDLIREVLSD